METCLWLFWIAVAFAIGLLVGRKQGYQKSEWEWLCRLSGLKGRK